MASATLNNPALARPVDYYFLAWFSTVLLLGLGGIAYLALVRCSGATLLLTGALFLCGHLAITAGMHRLYSHRSYQATKALEVLLLFFCAAVFQGPAIWWVWMHRRHHAYSDTELDPYTVKHGFWWAHFRWMLHASRTVEESEVKDLLANTLVRLQARYYIPLAVLSGLVLPTALALLWDDAFGGLLVAGFLRLCFQYNTTWAINSVAHTFGYYRYGSGDTARTNVWLALFTVGESYHERHHLAPSDWRLGSRWYDLDVGKWFIGLCALCRLAHSLKSTPEPTVIRMAHASSPST